MLIIVVPILYLLPAGLAYVLSMRFLRSLLHLFERNSNNVWELSQFLTFAIADSYWYYSAQAIESAIVRVSAPIDAET